MPLRIDRFNQAYFRLPRSALDLFLSGYRMGYGFVTLIPNEQSASMLLGKSRNQSLTMLISPPRQI
jgi:hypothetical protein